MTVAIFCLAYIVISLLIAYYKFTTVEYEYYQYTNVPKLSKGNVNTCKDDVAKSLSVGFLYLPMWFLICFAAFAVLLTAGILIVKCCEILGNLFM